jgi:hypothetical protein
VQFVLDICATRRAVLDVKRRDYNPVAFKTNNGVYQLIKKEHLGKTLAFFFWLLYFV